MSDKKNLILETARTLFNEKGYHNVTIRMIAQKMNMSSGNLNYHFKKREDIFETLYFEMTSVFDERTKKVGDIEISINQIKNDIESSMNRMVDYSFFWTDLYNLLEISDRVKEHFHLVYYSRKEGCFLLFKKMAELGLMRNSLFEEEFQMLADRMIGYGNTWLYSSKLYSNQSDSIQIEHFVNSYLSIVAPYLTNKGQLELKKVSPKFNYAT